MCAGPPPPPRRRRGPREGEEEGVSLRVDLRAAVAAEGFAHEAPVLREHVAVPVTQLLEQRRRPSMSLKTNVTVPDGSPCTGLFIAGYAPLDTGP